MYNIWLSIYSRRYPHLVLFNIIKKIDKTQLSSFPFTLPLKRPTRNVPRGLAFFLSFGVLPALPILGQRPTANVDSQSVKQELDRRFYFRWGGETNKGLLLSLPSLPGLVWFGAFVLSSLWIWA